MGGSGQRGRGRAEDQLPPGAGGLVVMDRPDAPQLEDGELGLERNSECAEAFSLLAVEPHRGLRIRVSGASLTGLEGLDVVAAEHVHVMSDAGIKGRIEALSHSRNALQTQGHPATETRSEFLNRASDEAG